MQLNQFEKDLSPLETIIKENYFDWETIIETVRDNSFEASLYPGFKLISDLIISEKFNTIPNIVGALLTTINEKIGELSGKQKHILEDLSSELFCALIEKLNSTLDGRECWKICIPIIKDTCEFKGYDFNVLSRMLKINFVKTHSHKFPQTSKLLPYYEWLGTKKSLTDLIRKLKDKEWIANVNEFKKIFSTSLSHDYTFSATSDNKGKLLVLFAELKEQNLIIPKRNKGHFFPLYLYGVDLEKRLFEKEPKRYMEN